MSAEQQVQRGGDDAVSQGLDKVVYGRASSSQARLFAVRPGYYRSDLPVIDELEQLAGGMGWVHDEARTGVVDHGPAVRWKIDEPDQSTRGGYVWVRVPLDGGCAIRDRRAFAAQMLAQRGWVSPLRPAAIAIRTAPKWYSIRGPAEILS